MLIAVYSERSQGEDADRCASMSASTAEAQAIKTIGRPPKKKLAKTLVDPPWMPFLARYA